MNAEIKAKWVEALRSGKYAQGRGRLVRSGAGRDEFCCLGVLCEVMGRRRDSSGIGYLDEAGGWCRSMPDVALLNEAGLKGRQMDDLIYLNDSSRKTFPQIADWIEANL